MFSLLWRVFLAFLGCVLVFGGFSKAKGVFEECVYVASSWVCQGFFAKPRKHLKSYPGAAVSEVLVGVVAKW